MQYTEPYLAWQQGFETDRKRKKNSTAGLYTVAMNPLNQRGKPLQFYNNNPLQIRIKHFKSQTHKFSSDRFAL